jgi:hypothetical protein
MIVDWALSRNPVILGFLKHGYLARDSKTSTHSLFRPAKGSSVGVPISEITGKFDCAVDCKIGSSLPASPNLAIGSALISLNERNGTTYIVFRCLC